MGQSDFFSLTHRKKGQVQGVEALQQLRALLIFVAQGELELAFGGGEIAPADRLIGVASVKTT